MKAVISVRHPGKINPVRQWIPLNFIPATHCIAFALDDQCGGLHALKMVCAELVWLTQWMKWVAQTDAGPDSAVVEQLIRQQAGDSASHRFPSDDQRAPINQGVDLVPETVQQRLRFVRGPSMTAASLPAHIGKLEADHSPTLVCETFGNRLHEWAVHACPGSVGKQHRDR